MKDIMLEIEGLPEKTFSKGEAVLEEGRPGTTVYILKDGSVSVTSAGSEICKINTPGTIFGEISALLNVEYTAAVTAEVETTFYVIDDLIALFKSNPDVCPDVARILALRVLNMNLLFAEIQHEIVGLQENSETKQASSKLNTLIQRMDEFWGRDIL